jgi:hypothetical protein
VYSDLLREEHFDSVKNCGNSEMMEIWAFLHGATEQLMVHIVQMNNLEMFKALLKYKGNVSYFSLFSEFSKFHAKF